MKIVPNRIIIILVLLLWSFASHAAPAEPPQPSFPPPPPGLPLDGGVLLLMVVSLAFGLYKIYKLNIKKASQ